VADEFNGGSLDPKWTWINPPAAQDVGATTPGHLHVVSTTGVDIGGATFTGNVLWERIVGDFNATMKFSTNPTAGGQKAGLMALLDTWNWYGVQKRYDSASGTVRWQIRATADAATTTRVDVANANPIPAWSRLVRAGNTFQAWTSDNGIAWLLRDTYSPTDEYPYAIRLAFFAADGTSGVPLAVDVDYIRVSQGPDATTSVSTRTGNVTPVDPTVTPTLSEIRLTFLGARPWIGISAPASNAHVTGIVPIRYANSSGAVRVTFEYNDGSGWMPIGSPVLPNGTFLWNTSGLNFV